MTLRVFWERYVDSEKVLRAWLHDAEASLWTGPNDIKAVYRSVSFVGTDRVVFNIKGNKYRLIVQVKYPFKVVYIRFIGTHADYDKVNAAEV